MPPLEDLVLVSETEFMETYSISRSAEVAVRGLREAGITFPIKYTSPFFAQLSRLATLVYFKGTLAVYSKEPEDGSVGYAPRYCLQLFVADNLNAGWVEGKLAPYFSVSSKTSNVAVGPNKKSHLNRPLARILYCLDIPTPAQHISESKLPPFISDLVLLYPTLKSGSKKELAYGLLLGISEAFLNVKADIRDSHWSFSMPVKLDLVTAGIFRRNVVQLLSAAFPGINFDTHSPPRERVGGSLSGPPLYYEGVIHLRPEQAKNLLNNYGQLLDLGQLPARSR